jgi:hypothetical protein
MKRAERSSSLLGNTAGVRALLIPSGDAGALAGAVRISKEVIASAVRGNEAGVEEESLAARVDKVVAERAAREEALAKLVIRSASGGGVADGARIVSIGLEALLLDGASVVAVGAAQISGPPEEALETVVPVGVGISRQQPARVDGTDIQLGHALGRRHAAVRAHGQVAGAIGAGVRELGDRDGRGSHGQHAHHEEDLEHHLRFWNLDSALRLLLLGSIGKVVALEGALPPFFLEKINPGSSKKIAKTHKPCQTKRGTQKREKNQQRFIFFQRGPPCDYIA